MVVARNGKYGSVSNNQADPSGRGSTAARLLGLWVRIPLRACECCVLSGRGLCDGLITRPEECY
jgi:hypothetical protein